jgi:hypothetical protein
MQRAVSEYADVALDLRGTRELRATTAMSSSTSVDNNDQAVRGFVLGFSPNF